MKKRQDALTRRELARKACAAPLAAGGLAPAFQGVGSAAQRPSAGIYRKLGVKTYINAYGTLTTLSGTLMPAEVVRAMEEASKSFVQVHDLQEKAGKRLAELIGCEAAFVTAGASAALCLATCAVTAGDDREKMRQLPDLTGMKSEIVIQKGHRSGYDHAFRMVGVRLIEVETAEEAQRAVNANTAAVAFVHSHNNLNYKVNLETMIGIAHKNGLPLILDAAAEIPPVENLGKFAKMGADLVAFSGGKNLRGPQCSGLLLGRRDLVRKAYANSSPNNYLPRIAKVGKEEVVGLLAAVELALRKDWASERREYHAMLDRVAAHLKDVPTVFTELTPNDDYSHSPRLSIQWDEQRLGITLSGMMQQLRDGEPGIIATDLTRYQPNWKGLGIFPYNLQPGEEMIVAKRVRDLLLKKG
ncbi:MAG: aminotransferase class V-fold PLP-dependent enzyme [Bryobacterales bacterium]|nr:aminotransferase class V-fold PLP-dependent enzyme [Bryobacterales bacterium]